MKSKLNNNLIERYSRQIILKNIGIVGQKKIINAKKYEAFLKNETKKAIKFQEAIDIDVMVHGEFERNDMVEYFGEQSIVIIPHFN